jgi:hypothetical protein
MPQFQDEVGFSLIACQDKAELMKLGLLEELVFHNCGAYQQRGRTHKYSALFVGRGWPLDYGGGLTFVTRLFGGRSPLPRSGFRRLLSSGNYRCLGRRRGGGCGDDNAGN